MGVGALRGLGLNRVDDDSISAVGKMESCDGDVLRDDSSLQTEAM